MSSVTEAGPCIRSNQLDFDDEVGFAAERALFEHVRSGDERPFCFAVSFTHPHDPYAIPQEWWDLYGDVDVPLPEHGHDPAAAQPHDLRLRQMCAMDDVEITDDQVRAARRAYYGADLVRRRPDRPAGRGAAADRAARQHRRDPHQRPRRHAGGARPLVQDELLRGLRPGAARGLRARPLRAAPGRVAGVTMDLLPTLVELAGGDDRPTSSEPRRQSLLPLLRRRARTAATWSSAEYLAEGAIAPIVMLRRGP